MNSNNSTASRPQPARCVTTPIFFAHIKCKIICHNLAKNDVAAKRLFVPVKGKRGSGITQIAVYFRPAAVSLQQTNGRMKKWVAGIFLAGVLCFTCTGRAAAQCSICTKTSQQQGEKAGRGMNGGIVYLMFIPLAIMGFIGFRWWQQEKANV